MKKYFAGNVSRGRRRSLTPKPILQQSPVRLARPVSQESLGLFEGVRCTVCSGKVGYFKSEKVSCWECGEAVCDLHCKLTRITKSCPKSRRWCHNCQLAASRGEIRSQLEAEIADLNLRTLKTKEECDIRSHVLTDLAGQVARGEERLREARGNAANRDQHRVEVEKREAEKQAALRKELSFYEDQIRRLRERRSMLLESATNGEWRLKTLDSEKKEASIKQIALLGQLQEAEKRVKMTISLRKLKEKVCESCRARLESAYKDDHRSTLHPSSEPQKPVPQVKNDCSLL